MYGHFVEKVDQIATVEKMTCSPCISLKIIKKLQKINASSLTLINLTYIGNAKSASKLISILTTTVQNC